MTTSSHTSHTPREKAADVLRDARRWILAGGLLGAVVGLAVAVAAPAPYEASATVLLRGTDGFVAFTTDGLGQWTAVHGQRSDYGTEEAVLTSQDVLAAAADSLDMKRTGESWDEVADRLSRSVRAERLQGRVARVTARAPSADRAADRANSVVEAYLGKHWSDQWQVVGREVAGRRGSRGLDDAVPPAGRSGPGPLELLGLGLLGGLLTGLAAGCGVSVGSPRIRHPWQAAGMAGAPAVEVNAGPRPAEGGGGVGRRRSWPLTPPWAGADGPRSVLLLPVGEGVDPVVPAVELARTARLQGVDAAVLDLATRTEAEGESAGAGRPGVTVYTLPPDFFTGGENDSLEDPGERSLEARCERLRERATDLSEEHDLLLIAAPGPGSMESVALLGAGRPAALVAGIGRTEKREWSRAVRALGRLEVPATRPIVCRPG